MNLLVLGGTRFVGRHIVLALLERGHAVTILARGQSVDCLPASVERLRGDRDEGGAAIPALRGRTWDACVDVSGLTPRQVAASVGCLRRSVGQYVFISAVRVYGDPTNRPVNEDHPRLPPAAHDVTEVDDGSYGPLKVACEDIVADAFDERCAILRPQAVLGPFDPVDRLSYWVRRASQGGEMLAPGDGSDHLQFIDAGDCARFARTVVEERLAGAFNVAGPRITWREFMDLLGVRSPTWVDADTIARANLTIGELPLFRPEHGRLAGLMDIDNRRAVAAGLRISDPRTTIDAAREWVDRSPLPPALSPERERALIADARR